MMQRPKDANNKECFFCRKKFSLFGKDSRHHCRNCGNSFCDTCSAKRAPLPHFGLATAERVCNDCYAKVTSGAMLQQRGGSAASPSGAQQQQYNAAGQPVQGVSFGFASPTAPPAHLFQTAPNPAAGAGAGAGASAYGQPVAPGYQQMQPQVQPQMQPQMQMQMQPQMQPQVQQQQMMRPQQPGALPQYTPQQYGAPPAYAQQPQSQQMYAQPQQPPQQMYAQPQQQMYAQPQQQQVYAQPQQMQPQQPQQVQPQAGMQFQPVAGTPRAGAASPAPPTPTAAGVGAAAQPQAGMMFVPQAQAQSQQPQQPLQQQPGTPHGAQPQPLSPQAHAQKALALQHLGGQLSASQLRLRTTEATLRDVERQLVAATPGLDAAMRSTNSAVRKRGTDNLAQFQAAKQQAAAAYNAAKAENDALKAQYAAIQSELVAASGGRAPPPAQPASSTPYQQQGAAGAGAYMPPQQMFVNAAPTMQLSAQPNVHPRDAMLFPKPPPIITTPEPPAPTQASAAAKTAAAAGAPKPQAAQPQVQMQMQPTPGGGMQMVPVVVQPQQSPQMASGAGANAYAGENAYGGSYKAYSAGVFEAQTDSNSDLYTRTYGSYAMSTAAPPAYAASAPQPGGDGKVSVGVANPYENLDSEKLSSYGSAYAAADLADAKAAPAAAAAAAAPAGNPYEALEGKPDVAGAAAPAVRIEAAAAAAPAVRAAAAVVAAEPQVMSPTSAAANKEVKADTDQAMARDWNEELQRLIEAGHADDSSNGNGHGSGTAAALEAQLARATKLAALTTEFAEVASRVGRVIIEELHWPNDRKTYLPAEGVGGVAGGEKYIVGRFFFKFALDWKGLYGGDDFAMKASSHELKGVRAYLKLGLKGLHVPLFVLIDYLGYRLICTSLLPLAKDSLVYGSGDQCRTVHFDLPKCNDLMRDAGARLNVKGHYVGSDDRNMIFGPGDLEVHHGKDNRLYVLDCARVFPPEAPRPMVPTMLLPANPHKQLTVSDVIRSSLLSEAKQLLNDHEPRIMTLPGVFLIYNSVGNSEYNHPAMMNADADERYRLNRLASMIAGYELRGDVMIVPRLTGQHLYNMLRGEFVASYGTGTGADKKLVPLSSDAFTGFGRHDAVAHNAEVKAASKHLLEDTIQAFALECCTNPRYTTSAEFVQALHARGINCRYLGKLRTVINGALANRQQSRFKNVSQRTLLQVQAFILTEVMARVVKNIIRAKLRGMKRSAVESTAQMKARMIDIVVGELNYILGAHTSTADDSARSGGRNANANAADKNMSATGPLPDGRIWNQYVKTQIEMKFGLAAPVLTQDELLPTYDLGKQMLRVPLLQTLSRTLGLTLNHNTLLRIQDAPEALNTANPLTTADVLSLDSTFETIQDPNLPLQLAAKLLGSNTVGGANVQLSVAAPPPLQAPVAAAAATPAQSLAAPASDDVADDIDPAVLAAAMNADDPDEAKAEGRNPNERKAPPKVLDEKTKAAVEAELLRRKRRYTTPDSARARLGREEANLLRVAKVCGEQSLEYAFASASVAQASARLGGPGYEWVGAAADDPKQRVDAVRIAERAAFNTRAVQCAKRALSCLNLPKHAFYPVELLFSVYLPLIEVQFNRGLFRDSSSSARRVLNAMQLSFGWNAPVATSRTERGVELSVRSCSAHYFGGHPGMMPVLERIVTLQRMHNTHEFTFENTQSFVVLSTLFPIPQPPEPAFGAYEAEAAWDRIRWHVFGKTELDVQRAYVEERSWPRDSLQALVLHYGQDHPTNSRDNQSPELRLKKLLQWERAVQFWISKITFRGGLSGSKLLPDMDLLSSIDADYNVSPLTQRLTYVDMCWQQIAAQVPPPGLLFLWHAGDDTKGRVDLVETRLPGASAPSRVADIQLQANERAILTTDGAVFVAGKNFEGWAGAQAPKDPNPYRYGSGHSAARRAEYESIPAYVHALRGKHVVQIGMGQKHLLMLTGDGHVYSCGANGHGELGHGDQNVRTSPRVVEALLDHKIVQICAGDKTSLFRTFRGEVFACGDNRDGQLGVGDQQAHPLPQQCKFVLPVVDMDMRSNFGMFVTASGELFRTGVMHWINEMIDQKYRVAPTLIPTPDHIRFVRVRAGDGFWVALTDTGGFWVTHRDDTQLFGSNDRPVYEPYQFEPLKDVQIADVQVFRHMIWAEDVAGNAYAWGSQVPMLMHGEVPNLARFKAGADMQYLTRRYCGGNLHDWTRHRCTPVRLTHLAPPTARFAPEQFDVFAISGLPSKAQSAIPPLPKPTPRVIDIQPRVALRGQKMTVSWDVPWHPTSDVLRFVETTARGHTNRHERGLVQGGPKGSMTIEAPKVDAKSTCVFEWRVPGPSNNQLNTRPLPPGHLITIPVRIAANDIELKEMQNAEAAERALRVAAAGGAATDPSVAGAGASAAASAPADAAVRPVAPVVVSPYAAPAAPGVAAPVLVAAPAGVQAQVQPQPQSQPQLQQPQSQPQPQPQPQPQAIVAGAPAPGYAGGPLQYGGLPQAGAQSMLPPGYAGFMGAGVGGYALPPSGYAVAPGGANAGAIPMPMPMGYGAGQMPAPGAAPAGAYGAPQMMPAGYAAAGAPMPMPGGGYAVGGAAAAAPSGYASVPGYAAVPGYGYAGQPSFDPTK